MKTFLNRFSRQFIGSVAPARLVYMAAATPEDALKEMAEKTVVPKAPPKNKKVNKVAVAMLNIEKKKAGILSRGLWGTVNVVKNLKARVTGDVVEEGRQALTGVVKNNIEKATAEKIKGDDPLKNVEDKAMKKLLAVDAKGNRKLILARMRATVIDNAIHQVDAAITALENRKAAYGDALESLKAGKALDKKVEDLQLRKDILDSLKNDNDQKISELQNGEKFDDVKKYDALIREVVSHSGSDNAGAFLDEALRENSLGEGKKLQNLLSDLLKAKKISEQDYKTGIESAKLLRGGFRGLGKTARLYYAEDIRSRHYLDYDQLDATGAAHHPSVVTPNFVNAVNAGAEDFLKGQFITIVDSTGRKMDTTVVKRDTATHSLLLADRKNKYQFYSISLDPTKLELLSYNTLNKATDTTPLNVPCMVEKDTAGKIVRRREYKDPSRVYLTV